MTGNDTTIEALAHRSDILAAAKRLSAVNGWRSVVAIATQWLIIAASIAVAYRLDHWLAYLCAIVIIGTRQHALGILMHEGVHYRLFRNRTLNDVVSDMFCAIPIALLSERYRYDHLRHHADPNTGDDPYWVTMLANPADWQWPKTPLSGSWVFLRDALGIGVVSFVKDWLPWFPWTNHLSKSTYPPPLTRPARVRVYLMFLALLFALYFWNLWWAFLIFWFLPLVTVAQLAFKIRTMAEHLALPPGGGQDSTRHIVPTLLERLLICPLNIQHHLTHHLFPSLPWYNLPEMSALLFTDPQIRARAHVGRSYFGPVGIIRSEMILGGSSQR